MNSTEMHMHGYRTALLTITSMIEAVHEEGKGLDETAYQVLIQSLYRMERNSREGLE